MKKVFLFCLLSFLINLIIISQPRQSAMTDSVIPVVSGENIKLFTDRNIYSVNEKIFFTAEYSCLKELDSLTWSNVLYVELIKWNGTKLVQMKLKLIRPGTSGSMGIPGNIISGNYYLRAYTKWMRNFSTSEYAYLLVKIVNPFSSATDEGTAEISPPAATTILNPVQKSLINGVSCRMDKNEYKPGEKAEVVIQINDRKLAGSDRYCVSVAKVGSIDTTCQPYKPEPTSPESDLSNIEYLPEIKGITISGAVIDKSTKLPQKNVFVSLSETQKGEYFSVYKTNERGRFVFSLPDMHGQYDFFIQTEMPSEIKIDNSFCNKSVKLRYVPFKLNKDEIDFVNEMVINQQLSEKFLLNNDTLADSQHAKEESLAFYGSKTLTYYTEKYIELPNIEEFINEIVMEATIIKEKGNVQRIGMRRTDLPSYQPLLFLDNIQIKNDDRLLKTPLSRIESIKVIDNDYIVAAMRYSGILIICSKNKDFAGLELNKNSTFFTSELFSDTYPCYDYGKRSSDSRIPDRRNLLYWNPDVQLSADKNTAISFYTSDNPGDYVVFIRGKNNNDNHEIYGRFYFSVK